MRCDWSGYGGLLHVLRNGGLDETVMADARRDAADEIERLNDRLDRGMPPNQLLKQATSMGQGS